MIKNKLKRALNGVLALVMCVGTLTTVSYVKPMTVSAATGSQEWYNPALRWKNTTNNRERTLIANSVVSQETMHCSNKNCPTNKNDGFNDMQTGAGGNQGTYVSQSVGTLYRVPEYTESGNSYQSSDGAWYYGPHYPIDSGVTSEFDIGSDGNKPNKIPETNLNTAWAKAKGIYGINFAKEDLVPSNPIFIGYKKTTSSSVAYGACRSSLGESVKEVDTNGDGNTDEYWIIDKDGNTVPEYRNGFMPYVYMKPVNEKDLTKGFVAIKDAKYLAPASGGRYTKHHLTASYCNSCGVWGTSDNDVVNSQINNGMFSLNSCHICYGSTCGIDHDGDGSSANDEHVRTSLEKQAAASIKVERTFSSQETDDSGNGKFRNDNFVHKITDTQLPICIYCFGTAAITEEEMTHIHPHVFDEKMNTTQVSSSNSISITKTCLDDKGAGDSINTVSDYADKIKTGTDDLCVTAAEKNLVDTNFCLIHDKTITTNDFHKGCGFQKTDIYTANMFVDDYVGIVDGNRHYASFNGKESKGDKTIRGDAVTNDDGTITQLNGSGTLTATLEWEDGEAPSRVLAGTSSKNYTITYSLPWDSGGDLTKTIVKKGTATVTLIPGHVSDSAEGDKNYWDQTGSGKDNIVGNLIGNLPQNDISSIYNGSNVNFAAGTSDGIRDFDSVKIETITREDKLPAPGGSDDVYVTGQYIIEGKCPNRGSDTSGGDRAVAHAYQYMYSDSAVDFWKCIYCSAWLPVRTREVQTHIHHYYKYDEIPATCNTKGVIFRRCVCGAMETEDTAVNPANHVGTTHKTDPAPTCENVGYEYDECVGCGAKINGQQMEKLGHQWKVTGVTNNFGHVPNYVIQTCERCNKKQTVSSAGIPEDEIFTEGDGSVNISGASHTAHDYEYRYTERECENGTYEIWQCSVCSEIERRLVESGKGHIWIEQGDKRDSTCTVNGFRNYICSNCGGRKLEMLPLDGNVHEHTVRTFSRPESEKCTEDFMEYETCTACGKNVNFVQAHKALGHDYKVLLDTKATCHEMGHHVEQCLRCF